MSVRAFVGIAFYRWINGFCSNACFWTRSSAKDYLMCMICGSLRQSCTSKLFCWSAMSYKRLAIYEKVYTVNKVTSGFQKTYCPVFLFGNIILKNESWIINWAVVFMTPTYILQRKKTICETTVTEITDSLCHCMCPSEAPLRELVRVCFYPSLETQNVFVILRDQILRTAEILILHTHQSRKTTLKLQHSWFEKGHWCLTKALLFYKNHFGFLLMCGPFCTSASEWARAGIIGTMAVKTMGYFATVGTCHKRSWYCICFHT